MKETAYIISILLIIFFTTTNIMWPLFKAAEDKCDKDYPIDWVTLDSLFCETGPSQCETQKESNNYSP